MSIKVIVNIHKIFNDSNDIKDGKLFISGYDIWLFPEEFEYL